MAPHERRTVPDGSDDAVPRDSVDLLLFSWADRRPDLDFSPVALVARLARVRAHIDAALDQVFAEHGLGASTFAVLVTLARVDDGTGVTQRRLMDELDLTSGTMSVRVDRMVETGLVIRSADPESKRNSLVSLTPRGRELAERVIPAHLDNEARMLAGLTDDERGLLAGLLRKLLVEFEGSAPAPDARCRLGLTLAPVHRTITVRQSAGLPPALGLLVRSAQPGSPAARAGIRTGDVLLRAGHYELRSIAALHAALADTPHGGDLRLRIARGTGEHGATVSLAHPAEPRSGVTSPAGYHYL